MVAVPVVAKVTVMSSDAAIEDVAVKVTVVPEFSATEVCDVDKLIDG